VAAAISHGPLGVIEAKNSRVKSSSRRCPTKNSLE
jgi:hypothetical protein